MVKETIILFADLDSNMTYMFQLDQASLGMSREYLIKGMEDKVVSAYYSYMVDLAVIFGADRSKAETELKESLLFEIELANVSIFINLFICLFFFI